MNMSISKLEPFNYNSNPNHDHVLILLGGSKSVDILKGFYQVVVGMKLVIWLSREDI